MNEAWALSASLIFALVALAVWVVLFPLRAWLAKREVLDLPSHRGLHEHPTPRGGGIVIVLFSTSAMAVVWGILRTWRGTTFALVVGGGLLVAVVSLWDDIRRRPVAVRLAAHILGAAMAVVGVGRLEAVDLGALGTIHLGWLGLTFTLFWIVGLTNAYNFMDGIDGIAGALAFVAGLGWFFLIEVDPMVRAAGLVLAASNLGFLLHNWPPAKIFMGDVGSAFVGYILAVMTIIASRNDARFTVVGLLLVWPFVFDTTFTIFRRLVRGENVLVAHRSHLYQRLVIAGLSHRFVTLLYAVLAALGGGLARIWLNGGRLNSFAAVGGVIGAGGGLWGFVRWAERPSRPTRGVAPPGNDLLGESEKIQ